MANRLLALALPLVALLALLPAAPPSQQPAPGAAPFYRCADLSFLPQLDAAGVTFSANGVVQDALAIFRARGVNLVRVRLWHAPFDGHSNAAEVLALARRVRDAGMALLLNVHYADSWADPSQQPIPLAWRAYTPGELADAVYRYTRDVVGALVAQGTPPAMIAIGNEINDGMLWDVGRISQGNADTLAALLRAGVRGAHESAPDAAVMLHVAGAQAAAAFFARLPADVDYDVIGISHYPFWHGDLPSLRDALARLWDAHGKPLLVVETAHPFTLDWDDDTHNVVGAGVALPDGYPPTPEGQAAYLWALRRVVAETPGGVGFCYWAPDWVTGTPDGTPWENLALFGFAPTQTAHPALPALAAFRE